MDRWRCATPGATSSSPADAARAAGVAAPAPQRGRPGGPPDRGALGRPAAATATKGLQVHVSQLRKELRRAGGPNGAALLTRASGYVLEVPPRRRGHCPLRARGGRGRAGPGAGRPDRDAPTGCARRSRCGAARRLSTSPTTLSPRTRSPVWRTGGSSPWRTRIDADLALGRHRPSAELERWSRRHPPRERLRGQLMLALYRCGRQADALETYREGRRSSVDELGLEPGPERGRWRAPDPRRQPGVARRPGEAARAPAARRAPAGPAGGRALLRRARRRLPARRDEPRAPRAALDMAPNSIAAIDAAGALARSAPVARAPTDIAAAGRPAVRREHRLVRADHRRRAHAPARADVPLPMRPAALAVNGDTVWVADGRRGLLVRLDAATSGSPHARLGGVRARREAVASRASTRPPWRSPATRRGRPTARSRLVRADASGRVTRSPSSHRLDGIAAGAGAVWAISRRGRHCLRIDPRAPGSPTTSGSSRAPAARRRRRAVAATAQPSGCSTATRRRSRGSTRGPGRHRDHPALARAVPARHRRRRGRALGRGLRRPVTRFPPGAASRGRRSWAHRWSAWRAPPRRVWLAAIALDQQIPGGERWADRIATAGLHRGRHGVRRGRGGRARPRSPRAVLRASARR